MIAGLICRILGHRVDRRRVKHEGEDFYTNCRRCKAPLVREPDGWHKVA